jgi:hypothetical protein
MITALTDLPATAATHFRLTFLDSVRHVVERLAENLGSIADVLDQFPFAADYIAEIERLEVSSAALREWTEAVPVHLPLRALRNEFALDDRAISLLFAIGLIEEDPRFGFLIESAQTGGQQRPALGLLTAWWRDDDGAASPREAIGRLQQLGLVQVLNPETARLQWIYHAPAAIWDALRGEGPVAAIPGVAFRPPHDLPAIADLVLPPATRHTVGAIPDALRSGDARAVIVRGPHQNGRRTIARAIARSIGRGVLEVHGPLRADDERLALIGALAVLRHAMPIVCVEPGIGETCELPPLGAYDGPLAVVLGKQGSVTGAALDRAIVVRAGVPGPDERRTLWRRSLPAEDADAVALFADQFRVTSGAIHRAASLARAQVAVEGRVRTTPEDVRTVSRALHAPIERLATFVPASGGWESIAGASETLAELRGLESRCRHRERLHEHLGPALSSGLSCGVRALFSGPSGTGKTMAARLLAASLQKDLYRLDLASVVNKYIGETEKSLDQLFACAEALDVVLLIDEGDALLTGRTAVQSSNDRYANLETNYLLQRLEGDAFEGVLIVTTNAVNRIDAAFLRRMDVVVEFRMPGPHERWLIWQLHLPLDHRVDMEWLQDVAVRCDLSGGQIRNAVLHASLAALDEGRRVATWDVERAVHREYRKLGAVCPLPAVALGA